MKSFKLGHISGVNGRPLYREIGRDNHGLIKYSCFRSTSSVEGYHQNIISKSSSINSGQYLADYVPVDSNIEVISNDIAFLYS